MFVHTVEQLGHLTLSSDGTLSPIMFITINILRDLEESFEES